MKLHYGDIESLAYAEAKAEDEMLEDKARDTVDDKTKEVSVTEERIRLNPSTKCLNCGNKGIGIRVVDKCMSIAECVVCGQQQFATGGFITGSFVDVLFLFQEKCPKCNNQGLVYIGHQVECWSCGHYWRTLEPEEIEHIH